MARLTQDQWDSIRTSYEYDPDEPSLSVASSRAGIKYNFKPPAKSSVSARMDADKKSGQAWERRGTLAGINSTAQRKADMLVDANGESKPNEPNVKPNDGKTKPNIVSYKKEQAAREESEDLRAEVIARHRMEWKIAITLRNESLVIRKSDVKHAFDLAKLAKITTEMIKIQQDGERKAWGLEEIDIDVSKLSEDQLNNLISGKSIK